MTAKIRYYGIKIEGNALLFFELKPKFQYDNFTMLKTKMPNIFALAFFKIHKNFVFFTCF